MAKARERERERERERTHTQIRPRIVTYHKTGHFKGLISDKITLGCNRGLRRDRRPNARLNGCCIYLETQGESLAVLPSSLIFYF